MSSPNSAKEMEPVAFDETAPLPGRGLVRFSQSVRNIARMTVFALCCGVVSGIGGMCARA